MQSARGPVVVNSVVRFGLRRFVLVSRPFLFHVRWTCVADRDLLIRNGMLSICRTGVDSMDVVYATANGVLLNDSDAHVGFGDLSWR